MERNIVFYECQDIEKLPEFDRLAAVEGINDLDDDDWRVPDGDSDLAVIVDKPGTATQATHLRFLRIRPDAPFKLDAARQLEPVEIDADESITEFTWVVIWPDNFMAAVSSRDAPGHKKLGYYFNIASQQATHIVNLFRPDVVERLREIRENGLRNVQVKVRTSQIEQIEQDANVRGFKQLWNAGRGTDAATIGIELSVGRSGEDAVLSDAIGEEAQELAELGDLLESMHVKGYDRGGEIRTINMKQERIKDPIGIESSDSNDDIYKGIRRARQNVEADIDGLDSAARGS